MLKLYNSLVRDKQAFVPLTPGKVNMYVCGMTVYDYCHLGHARVLVVFDMVTRWLRASGYDVTYARNITDIDDKIIKRANENREPMEALTARFIAAMNEDADARSAAHSTSTTRSRCASAGNSACPCSTSTASSHASPAFSRARYT